ncbi:MAG: ABC transporter permease subunit [Proteobacteria bacterium]|nr:ABC transporter permease subunit [Pseudomonadota bacterium]
MNLNAPFLVCLGHELRLLRIESLSALIGFVLAAAFAYAAWNGTGWAQRQQEAVATAQTAHETRVHDKLAQLNAMEAGTYHPPSAFLNPANPLWIGLRHASTPAALPATALQAAAVGQSDLFPPYLNVSADTRDTWSLQEDVENPTNLLAGAFDPTFVAVVLLPLILIALSYDLLPSERERGTLALLLTQPVSLTTLLAAKVTARAVVVLGGASLFGALSLALVSSNPLSTDFLLRIGLWTALVWAYGLFWLALCATVSSRGGSSAAGALTLCGLWLLFQLIIPTLASSLAQAALPAPSRSAMVSEIRAAQDQARQRGDASLARYLREHGEERPDTPVLHGHDLDDARRRIVILLDSNTEVERILDEQERRRQAQLSLISWLRFLSPPVLMHDGLSEVAGTGEIRLRHFHAQAEHFGARWREHFLTRALRNEALSSADYARFPAFDYQELPTTRLIGEITLILSGLIMPAALLGLLARRRLKKPVAHEQLLFVPHT